MSKKQHFTSGISFGAKSVDFDALEHLALTEPDTFMARTQELIDKGEISWEKVRDLRGLFNALIDAPVTTHVKVIDKERAIQTSAFPLLCGSLTVAALNAAYDAVPTIGQELVRDISDDKKITVMANVYALDNNIDRVNEGDDFPEIGAGEDHVEIRHKRNGRRLSITAETLEENNVADLVNRINALGDIAANMVEEQTIRRVYDVDGSKTSATEPYAYRPNGVGTTLYSASANTPGVQAPSGTQVNNNALVDETDLDAARAVLAAMKDKMGKRISIPLSRCKLVVPDALVGTAQKILNSEYVPGVENEVSNWGPRGSYRPTLVSSPKIDDVSTTCWMLGDFQRQFVRKWKLQMEYVTLSNDTESFLKSRIAFQARIAWDVEIGATDYVYVVRNLASTTAPGD